MDNDKITTRIIKIRYNSWQHPNRNYENLKWLVFRLGLFLDLVLPCLKRQTFKDFKIVALVHPETPAEISQYFPDLEKEGVIVCDDYRELRRDIYEEEQPEIVYETRLDSDDLIAPEVMGVYSGLENVEVGFFQIGYYYNMLTGELFNWDYPDNSSPQFSTYLLPGEEWAYSHKNWFDTRGGGMHTAARWWDKKIELPGRMIMVLGSGTNTSDQSRFCKGKILEPENIFETFGLTPELREKYQELTNDF